LATKACALTNWTNYAYLVILSDAYAEAGDFDSAIKHLKKAADLSPQDLEFEALAKERLERYQGHKTLNDE